MRMLLPPLLFGSSLLSSALVGQVNVDFSSALDLSDRFVLTDGVVSYSAAGQYLYRGDIGGSNGALFYNSTAVGGTTFGGTRDLFDDDFIVSVDFSISATSSGTSLGIYSKVPEGESSGYGALFRILNDGDSADFRLFDSNGIPSSAGVGTAVGTKTYDASASPLAMNTFYTFKVHIVDTVSTVEFYGSIWEQGGDLIHDFGVLTDGTSPAFDAGQVGFRLSSYAFGAGSEEHYRVDNISITAIPEPSAFVFVLGAFVGISIGSRRRRRV